jgi:hypothetical protein
MRLIDDWKWVITRAWSARLMLVAAGLSGCEALMSVFADNPPIPRTAFAVLFCIITAAAFVARIIAQR